MGTKIYFKITFWLKYIWKTNKDFNLTYIRHLNYSFASKATRVKYLLKRIFGRCMPFWLILVCKNCSNSLLQEKYNSKGGGGGKVALFEPKIKIKKN